MALKKVSIGLRTVKTAAAILAAMVIVDQFGATSSRLIFAMLGAMSAVQPTFRDSLETSAAQTVGVVYGALAGVLLTMLPVSPLTAVGVGVIALITLYNTLHLTASPSLPCFILVMICTDTELAPISYALGRIWDTAIGLGVGMGINMLVFPYDNSRKIQATVESLDRDLLHFLEDMFDGDDHLPGADSMNRKIQRLKKQLEIFANQRLILHLRRQRQELERYQACERKAGELISHLEVLAQLERPGRLSPENRRRLEAGGAVVRDPRPLDSVMELDVVTNFHVDKILSLRRELLEALERH